MVAIVKNYGFQNEWDFFYYLNNKKVGEVNSMFKEFLKENFSDINDNMIITSYVNLNKTKEDIWIKIGEERKSISIKMGKSNTMHSEYIYNFTDYLEKEKVSPKIINIILEYFFADGTRNGSGTRKLTFPDYKRKIKRKISKVNKYFIKHEELLIKLINRFVIGKTDILIHGTISDFTYITKEEIINFLINVKKDPSSAIHFSHLLFSVRSRNNEIDKFILQIKWYSLKEDIDSIRQNKNLLVKN